MPLNLKKKMGEIFTVETILMQIIANCHSQYSRLIKVHGVDENERMQVYM